MLIRVDAAQLLVRQSELYQMTSAFAVRLSARDAEDVMKPLVGGEGRALLPCQTGSRISAVRRMAYLKNNRSRSVLHILLNA
jgi:hypothetical protein